MSSIIKVDTIQNQSGANIISESSNVITVGASGDTITVPSGATASIAGTLSGSGAVDLSSATVTLNSSMKNTPAFAVQLTGSNQSITTNTLTLVAFNTTEIDTASAWSGASDYKWTVPSGQGGKYLINLSMNAFTSSNNIQDFRMELHKNGGRILMKQFYSYSADGRHVPLHLSHVISLSAGDYLQAKAHIQATSPQVRADANETFMSGFKLVE